MQMVSGKNKKLFRHHDIGSFSKVGLRWSKARYLTVCPKRHQPGGFESIKSFSDWHGWCFFFFPFFDKEVKKLQGFKNEKTFMLFHILSRVTDLCSGFGLRALSKPLLCPRECHTICQRPAGLSSKRRAGKPQYFTGIG